MAARVKPTQTGPVHGDVEKGQSPGTDFQHVVRQPFPWQPIATIIAVVLFIFWIIDRVEQRIEKEISPINDAVTSLHTKFDNFEKAYAQDRLNHIKDHHIESSSGTGDD